MKPIIKDYYGYAEVLFYTANPKGKYNKQKENSIVDVLTFAVKDLKKLKRKAVK